MSESTSRTPSPYGGWMGPWRAFAGAACLVALAAAGACGAPDSRPTPPAAQTAPVSASAATPPAVNRPDADGLPAADVPASAPRRNLRADEARGGHTIARHVGWSDTQLRERLRRERGIRAASAYTDLATAEQTVAAALAASAGTVARWESRAGPRPNLVIDYTAGASVGRTLRRGTRAAQPCPHVVVVLRWHEQRDQAYVLTSYPECGR